MTACLLTEQQHAQIVALIESLGRFSPQPASIWKHYYASAQGDFVDLREYRERAEPLVEMLKAMKPQEPVACIYNGNQYMRHEFMSDTIPEGSTPLYTLGDTA